MEEILTSPQIKTLVQFLLHNGNSVISGHTKFSVTPQILKEINAILDKLKEDIFVSSLTNADLINKYATKHELMFLYDFVKKTPKLKISNTVSSHDFNVDIGDFSNLKYLELYKFNVKHVKNVQFLHDHLEMIVCIRSVENVGDVFLNSDSDSKIWSKLRHAILSRNNIKVIDQSFIFTPWLQYLDISYNHLTDLRPLKCLRNLTYLNASYNSLTEIPEFSLCELKILLLNYNHITDVSEISKLKNLQECDLSGNCIAEHVNLLPFSELPSLVVLNITRNPIWYDPMHRSYTCGYLHENVADQYFLLNGRPLVASEKEFIRRCSRLVVNKFTNRTRTSLSSSNSNEDTNDEILITHEIVKSKTSRKNVREAVIADLSEKDEKEKIACSTPIINNEDTSHLEMKEKIEYLRDKYGEDGWLHGNAASAVECLLNIDCPVTKTNSYVDGVPISEIFNSKSPANLTKIILENSLKEREIFEESTSSTERDKTIEETFENALGTYESCSSNNEESDPDDDCVEYDLWLVEKIADNYEECIFLTLSETELAERNKKNNKVITAWSIDQIQRYVKISTAPFVISLHFDVPRRNDRTRKYRMEYADAQKLIACIEKEFEKKTLTEFNQKLLHCMKCSAYFCVEMRLRKSGFIEHETNYCCSTCGSEAVIEVDESSIQSKTMPELPASPPKTAPPPSTDKKVTQSPSLSSIGSAASLDQGADAGYNSDSNACYHESDIEIMSNPSQSSIEVLEIHGSDNTRTVLKFVDTPASTDTTTAMNSSNNYILTESSSSGSMTDSICTSYETSNQVHCRGPQRSSQTVDEVLQEESYTESSPKKSLAEIEMRGSERRLKLDFTSVLGDVLQTFGSKLISTSPQKSSLSSLDFDGPLNRYEYSYTDFKSVDPRIKFYMWDQIIPTKEEILAVIKAEMISKNTIPNQLFPGFFVLTNQKVYLMKITKKEKGDPSLWLQKYENFVAEKVKLIKPIYWKQGFSIEVEDRPSGVSALKYLVMLYDQKRTQNFLSFIKDLNTVHVQKLDDSTDDKDLCTLLQLDEHVRNFTMSESIAISRDKTELKKFVFVGLITTNSGFSVVKGDTEWLLSYSTTKPTILYEESMGNLVRAVETKNSLILQFLDEKSSVEYWWHIKTVCTEASHRILDAIHEPWSEMFQIELPCSLSAN